jgi:lipopolysaccharide transport system ATP-binding protein
MPPAIVVERLGKRYQLGEREPYGALRDSIARAARAPWRMARRIAGTARDATPWVAALDDVSFDVGEGEVVGIIGRNGSGKSTLLKILSRITEPSSGRAEVRGRVGSLLEVGTGFHPELTGRENVFVNGAILGMRRREIARRFDEIIDFADVARFVDTPVKHYSSGMQMRLAFAVAAHLEPEILLVDEVLAVGDIEFQKKCLGKIGAVSQDGRTVLLVSHQMNQLRRLCRRCVWLEAGRVREIGPGGDTLAHYERALLAPDDAAAAGRVFRRWQLAAGGHIVRAVDDPVTIAVQLALTATVSRGHLGMSIYSERDELVAGWAFEPLDLQAGLRDLHVTIDSLPLRPGSYRLVFTLFDRGNNMTGGALVEQWAALPPLALDVPPLSHPQDLWAGVLNVPARLVVADETGAGTAVVSTST